MTISLAWVASIGGAAGHVRYGWVRAEDVRVSGGNEIAVAALGPLLLICDGEMTGGSCRVERLISFASFDGQSLQQE